MSIELSSCDTFEKGVEFLVQTFGADWINKIDLDKLYMGYTYSCVIGQLSAERDIQEFCDNRGDPNGYHNTVFDDSCVVDGIHFTADDLTKRWKMIVKKLRMEQIADLPSSKNPKMNATVENGVVTSITVTSDGPLPVQTPVERIHVFFPDDETFCFFDKEQDIPSNRPYKKVGA